MIRGIGIPVPCVPLQILGEVWKVVNAAFDALCEVCHNRRRCGGGVTLHCCRRVSGSVHSTAFVGHKGSVVLVFNEIPFKDVANEEFKIVT